MSIANKYVNRMFSRVSGVVWDMATGQIGLQTAQGIFSLVPSAGENGTVNYTVSVNPFDQLSQPVPAFAMLTPLNEVTVGDIIVGDKEIIGWVVETLPASFRVKDHNGAVKVYAPPQTNIAGLAGVKVVRNLFSLAGGSSTGGAVGQLIMTLMATGQDAKIEKLLPVILATGAAAPAAPVADGSVAAPAAMNPMLLMALTGGLGGSGGSKKDMLLPLLMSGALGGAPAASGAGGMNAMLPLLLMGDGGLGGGKKDMLITMALMGGLGGGAAGGINPMLLMALSGDDDNASQTSVPPLGLGTGSVSPRIRSGVPVLRQGE